MHYIKPSLEADKLLLVFAVALDLVFCTSLEYDIFILYVLQYVVIVLIALSNVLMVYASD